MSEYKVTVEKISFYFHFNSRNNKRKWMAYNKSFLYNVVFSVDLVHRKKNKLFHESLFLFFHRDEYFFFVSFLFSFFIWKEIIFIKILIFKNKLGKKGGGNWWSWGFLDNEVNLYNQKELWKVDAFARDTVKNKKWERSVKNFLR